MAWLIVCPLSVLAQSRLRLGSEMDSPDVLDINELVDFIRRVQTPYYEEARQHFNDPDVLERLSDSNEVYPYLPKICERVVREAVK